MPVKIDGIIPPEIHLKFERLNSELDYSSSVMYNELKRKYKFSRKKRFLILTLVVMAMLLGIGYAYFTSTLEVNGTTMFRKSNWDIHLDNVKVTIDSETGEIHIYSVRDVVEVQEDPLLEITVEDARKIDSTYNAGDVVNLEIKHTDENLSETVSDGSGGRSDHRFRPCSEHCKGHRSRDFSRGWPADDWSRSDGRSGNWSHYFVGR